MPQTITEKIAQTHMAEGPSRPLRAGDFRGGTVDERSLRDEPLGEEPRV